MFFVVPSLGRENKKKGLEYQFQAYRRCCEKVGNERYSPCFWLTFSSVAESRSRQMLSYPIVSQSSADPGGVVTELDFTLGPPHGYWGGVRCCPASLPQ